MELAQDQHKPLSMEAASKAVPTKTSPAAVWRWCRKGVVARNGQRIYLEHCRYGRRLFTTKASLDAFAKAIADADLKHLAPRSVAKVSPKGHRDANRRRADVDAAFQRLEENGLI